MRKNMLTKQLLESVDGIAAAMVLEAVFFQGKKKEQEWNRGHSLRLPCLAPGSAGCLRLCQSTKRTGRGKRYFLEYFSLSFSFLARCCPACPAPDCSDVLAQLQPGRARTTHTPQKVLPSGMCCPPLSFLNLAPASGSSKLLRNGKRGTKILSF